MKHYWLAWVLNSFSMAQFHGGEANDEPRLLLFCFILSCFFPAPAHAIPRPFVCVIHIPVAEDIAVFTSETSFELSSSGSGKQPTAVDGGRMVQRCLL